MSIGIVNQTREYGLKCHNQTNHYYDNHPYGVHLQQVYNIAVRFIHLIPEEQRDNVLAACWVHDVIEDCRQTYNDVLKATNETIAELAYALTNEKGKNRKERANDKYYNGIRLTPNAIFIKLCDRIANYQYSIDQITSNMALKYKKEMWEFVKNLYDAKYQEMFDHLTDMGDEE